MQQLVNIDNFVRAETARMFDGMLAQSGGVNQFVHLRGPTPSTNRRRSRWVAPEPKPVG